MAVAFGQLADDMAHTARGTQGIDHGNTLLGRHRGQQSTRRLRII